MVNMLTRQRSGSAFELIHYAQLFFDDEHRNKEVESLGA